MFGGAKTSKREKPDKRNYVIHHGHTTERTADIWKEQDYIQFAAYDPGIVNFGIRIERRYNDGRIIGLLYERLKIYESEDGSKISTLYASLSEFLNQHLEEIKNCHFHLIERQMKENYQSVRIQQHVQTYLTFHTKDIPLLPIIIEVNAQVKGRVLGCPSNLNKNGYKQWSAEKALQLLSDRNDTEGYEKLSNATKKDDLGDTVCMIEAMCVLLNFRLTSKVETINTGNCILEIYDPS